MFKTDAVNMAVLYRFNRGRTKREKCVCCVDVSKFDKEAIETVKKLNMKGWKPVKIWTISQGLER